MLSRECANEPRPRSNGSFPPSLLSTSKIRGFVGRLLAATFKHWRIEELNTLRTANGQGPPAMCVFPKAQNVFVGGGSSVSEAPGSEPVAQLEKRYATVIDSL